MQTLKLEQFPLLTGEIADYRFDGQILYSYSKPVLRTVENIRSNVALVKQITGNRVVPILIYLSKSPVPDKATRRFATSQLPTIYSAMAMVSESGLSQLIMKILFSFSKPPIPMRSFSSDSAGLEWLKELVRSGTN